MHYGGQTSTCLAGACIKTDFRRFMWFSSGLGADGCLFQHVCRAGFNFVTCAGSLACQSVVTR